MAEAGNAIFSHLPLLFAMGIAAGLSDDDAGAAVLAGAVGYFVLTAAAKTINAEIDMSFSVALLPVLSLVTATINSTGFNYLSIWPFLVVSGLSRL